VIDLMLGLPQGHKKEWYAFLRKGFMDDESKDMEFPAQYMFKDVPKDLPDDADPVTVVLEEMDHFNIERAMLGVGGRANVELIDEVCWFFPELRIVMRHGAEPWDALAVKLMLKWPNLYYSTSAFAPKFYPKTIIDFANTRGAHKVMYAGYFPMGLSLERIFK